VSIPFSTTIRTVVDDENREQACPLQSAVIMLMEIWPI
jgi:hypothetical protein